MSNERQRVDLDVTREELGQLEGALQTHKDTTASAKRGLRAVNEAKELGAATLVALEEQEEQMYRIRNELNDVNEGVEEAKGILAWFGMCCCCRCCGCTPPEMQKQMTKKKAKQELPAEVPDIVFDVNKVGANKSPGDVEMTRMDDYDQNYSDNASMASYASKGRRKAGRQGARGPSGDAIGGTLGQQINEHTAQQNDYLDQIGDGISELKMIAEEIGNTTNKQSGLVETTLEETERTSAGVQGLNDHKVLRKFK
eukprot:TRINITY_DN4962_c0_g2_i1.p1 TRINITY_DN4962_c0_g2~~TRINITY_DN4962_c0_g2_i1.p1  ORF type:complete len:255 (+),score=69.33 TRINITY_DN4962_c0_g2_i1:106-870(+)